MKKVLPLLVFIPFFAFSMEVIINHGYFGFATLAWREPWGMQIFIDLCIACFVASMWIRQDARKLGINPVPYLVLMVPLGSIATLAYLIRRSFVSEPVAEVSYSRPLPTNR